MNKLKTMKKPKYNILIITFIILLVTGCDETWEDYNTGNNDSFNRSIENSYWTITPTVNLDVPLNRFILLRVGTGYQFAIFEDWTSDNDRTLNSVPSDLNANSLFIQSGIYIGFFSF